MTTTTLTPIKAIRKHCIGCSGGSRKEVENCGITDCELYPYRFGRRPTEAENQEIRQAIGDMK